MKLLGILLVAAGAVTATFAQPNSPADSAATNAATQTYAPAAEQTNAPTSVRQLSLQDCIRLTLQNNLDLQIDRYQAIIPLYALRGAYGAYDPSLFISGQHNHSESAGSTQIIGGTFVQGSGSIYDENSFSSSLAGVLPWGTTYSLNGSATDTYGNNFPETSSGAASFALDQPLLKNFWVDSSRLNIRVAKNRLKYSEQTLRLQIMQTVTRAEQAYYDLIFDRENVLVQEKAVELAMRLVMENKKKVEVGAMAPLDEQQAESQAATSQAALIAARSTLAVQEATLKQLLTSQYSQWSDVSLVPTEALDAPRQFFSLQDSWSKGLTTRPEIVQAKLDLEKAGIQLKFDYNQLFPQLDVFGGLGYNGSSREFSDALYDVQQTKLPFYNYGGKITIPLANVTARNAYRSDKVLRDAVILSVKKMERDIMYAIDTDISQARSSYEQVGATRAAREYAAAALDAEQKKLDSGKSTTYTVLQMQRDLTTARGSEIQALDTYKKSLSQLSVDEGTTLERLHLNVEVK